ncbi:MAG: hypothetical protein DSM106950_13685 [Stigonema ocellatum SAG 48.90 = DSM 106950]|nr:hypothetical protein [Stigonema ocellatum SAG 48.90 = DSM 106950]
MSNADSEERIIYLPEKGLFGNFFVRILIWKQIGILNQISYLVLLSLDLILVALTQSIHSQLGLRHSIGGRENKQLGSGSQIGLLFISVLLAIVVLGLVAMSNATDAITWLKQAEFLPCLRTSYRIGRSVFYE